MKDNQKEAHYPVILYEWIPVYSTFLPPVYLTD